MRIFLDTNILVKSYLVWIWNNKSLDHSLLRDFWSIHEFIISDFVFLELKNVLPRYIANFDETTIIEFIMYLWLQIFESSPKNEKLLSYVSDEFDLQILCDVIYYKAILLVTENSKDFHKDKIAQDFGILIYTTIELIQYLKQ